MIQDYLIVHKNILPEYVEKVLKARMLLESKECDSISEAVQKVGISRSTYYKYKDYVFKPSSELCWKFTLALTMKDNQGILVKVLTILSNHQTSVVTIHQDIPINQTAFVLVTLNGANLDVSIEELMGEIKSIEGISDVSMIAME